MKIQKKKFLSNIIKIQILKKKYTQIECYTTIVQTLHSLLFLYFIIISSNTSLRNPLFAALKSFSTALLSFKHIPIILSCVLLVIGLGMTICFFCLMIGQDNIKSKENKFRVQRLMLKIIASLSALFDLLAPVLLIIIISDLELNHLDSIFLNSLNFFSIVLSEIIIVYCNELLLYSEKSIILLLIIQFIDGLLPYWITISLTCYQLYNTPFNKLPYLLVLITTIMVLLAEGFQADIDIIYMAILFVSIIMINFFIPVSSFIQENENQNDFLLAKITKIGKDEDLTSQQVFKLVFIFEKMHINHKQLISQELSSKLTEFSSKQITKNELICLLMMKLDIEAKSKPNDLNVKIQRYECQLLEKTFSITTLYLIEKLSLEVENRCIFDELDRMQSFLNKIQVEYLHSEDDINSALIFKTEKKIERFYDCIGLCIEQLVNLWNTASKAIISEDIFQRSLSKVISFEEQSLEILQQLKQYKNITFEIEIINFLHRMINIDGENLMEVDPFINQEQLKETKFILVSNQVIEDVSHIIAKQISLHGQSIIGLNFSQVLYDFYNIFLHEQMNSIVSISQARHEILIPFRILNHQKTFFLNQCAISILPDLTNGVKYIVNFSNKKEYVKKYAIYCLEDDIIQGLSQTFYNVFKIDESLFPEILLGRQLFNTDISSYINEQNIVKDIKIKCDLLFKDLPKKKNTTRRSKQHNSHPIMLTIRDIYKVKNLHYILFEMETKEETLTMTAKETIKTFVGQTTNCRVTANQIVNFCKINNPLESSIDDLLSRISNNFRMSYFKIILFLLCFIFILVAGSLIYIKIITQGIGAEFKGQLNIITCTNILTQNIYLLYYQYYQYYQVKNYPEQILAIQHYNIPAMAKEYYTKANNNAIAMLPYILSNYPTSQETYTKIFPGYTQQEKISAINLVDFLDSTKIALATNSPIFMVRNQHIISKIINAFLPYHNNIIDIFTNNMFYYLLAIFVALIIIFIIIKIIYFKICFFKWSLFKIYGEIGEHQMNSYLKRLEGFVDVLVHTKYYDKRGENSENVIVSQEVGVISKRSTASQQLKQPQSLQMKGVKKSGYFEKFMDKNVMILIPIITLFFFMLYFSSISTFAQESELVLNYSKELQTFSILILQRATQYFQTGMEAILPQSQRQGWQKAKTLRVPTQLTVELPRYFDSYKQIQKGMLDFNLCKYSYLNTGSLYKNINCSLILDGIMDKSFTQSYSYLLHKLQEQGGANIQDFGKQYRPHAKYPFFMQVCYARRTINNMLAVIQNKFDATVNSYIQYRQITLQNIISVGFLIIPIAIIVMLYFARQMKRQCHFAMKCFKVLPRKFIMKISMSKKLKNIGILDEIEMIAA